MLKPTYTKRFEKDIKLAKKRGKDLDKFKWIALKLLNDEPLLPKYRDHPLIGNYANSRECHIEPDWLLIYRKVDKQAIIFERIGTHSDLFK